MKRALLALAVWTACTLVYIVGYQRGAQRERTRCADADERRQFALLVAEIAFASAETSTAISRVALARCRNKSPLPPMVP